MAFLEERISVAVKYGASYGDDYAVEITTTAGGAEYRRLVHPYPVRSFRVDYIPTNSGLYTDILNIYHRAYGKFAGFRAKAHDDFTTNGLITAPTSLDQLLDFISQSTYQLIKEYGTDKAALSIGHPKRIIYKPVAATTLVSIGSIAAPASMWSVDTTTGIVTFVENVSQAITGISKAASAVVSFATGTNTFVVNESIDFSGITGMVEMNGLRGLITVRTTSSITVNINSTGFTTYTGPSGVATAIRAITGITKAAQAIISFAYHDFVIGQSVYFSEITGMVEMNGLRGLIVDKDTTTITVDIDSTLFTAYTGPSGVAKLRPEISEVVRGGCEFDIPVRFNGPVDVQQSLPDNREVSIDLMEILNP